MRLQESKSKNTASYYVSKTIYENGKERTIIVEKPGTHQQLLEKLNGQDLLEWARKYVEELNRKEEEGQREILVKYSPTKLINKGEQHCFKGS